MNTIESNTTINELDIEAPVGHPVDRGNEFERYLWVCCCSKNRTDKRIIIYFTQFSIALILIFFCIYMLISYPESCESNQLYMGLLTLVIGVYLPSPKLRKN